MLAKPAAKGNRLSRRVQNLSVYLLFSPLISYDRIGLFCFYVRFVIFAAVGDVVYDYADSHRKRKSGNLDKRAARKIVLSEVERYAADSDNEYRSDGIEVSVVGKVNVFEHLETAYRDETVHRDASAAHYAFGKHVDKGYKRRYERYEHAHYGSREYRVGRSVFGKRDAAYRFAVSGVRATAEERSDSRTYAVAQKSVVKTGVFEKVFFYDIRKVFVIRYVLSEFYDRDGYEENRKVSDCRAVELGGRALFNRFDKRELGIIEETLESEGGETFLYGSEIYYLHCLVICKETYAGKKYREYETRAEDGAATGVSRLSPHSAKVRGASPPLSPTQP